LELVEDLSEYWGLNKNNTVKLTDNIPFNEATLLKLNCDKSLAFLNWHSTLYYKECVKIIADWYKAFYDNSGIDMYELTKNQIEYYVGQATKQDLQWTN
jgi:CDP-glucose 4,6-dehydratase